MTSLPHPLDAARLAPSPRERGERRGEGRIRELGPIAARTLAMAHGGRIVARFERSAYLELGDDLVCIGTPDLGSGPLNARVESAQALDAIRRARHDEVVCRDGVLRIGRTSLSFANARLWRPTSVALPIDARRLARGVEHVRALARTRVPSEGLASLVAEATGSPLVTEASGSSALACAGRKAALALHAWLGGGDDARLSPLAALIGLGPGLTPSGDDFLGGALVALHGYGRACDAQRLAGHLRLEGATHPISVAHWRAACEGLGSDALHACLRDMAEGRHAHASLARVAAIGHTSGWDALAGAMTVAAALSRATAGAGADYRARNTRSASSAACAFDGATATPAVSSVRTWRE